MTSPRPTPRCTATLTRFALALSMSLLLTSCQQDAAEQAEAASAETASADDASTKVSETDAGPATPDAETSTVVTQAAPPPIVPGTDAAILQNRSDTMTAAPGFDSKHFAGMYVEGDNVLDITDDGLFVLNLGGDSVEGTWSPQAGGKTVLLDPNSKGQQDRTVQILSDDSVKIDGGAMMQRHHGHGGH